MRFAHIGRLWRRDGPLGPKVGRGVGALVFSAGMTVSAAADAAICPASAYVPRGTTREAVILEAGQLATDGKYADARATYLIALAKNADDAEALFGLARIDAWEGCFALSEKSYRRAVGAHPKDGELRAGLIDLYTWEGRHDEARRLIDEGLALDPASPALLSRRGRLRYWEGDARAAVADVDAALRGAPDDPELRTLRERMYLGEARAIARLDHYPSALPDLYSLSTSVLQRIKRFEVWGGAQALRRDGGARPEPVTDFRLPIGVGYHPTVGSTVGAEFALGVPATAIPNWAVRVFGVAPLTARLSAHLGYAYWNFKSGARVHILTPSIGLDLPRDVHVDFRAWVSSVTLLSTGDLTKPGSTELALALGPAVQWATTPRLTLGAFYTYGAELDQNPTLYQVVTFKTHAMGTFADVKLAPTFGVRPLLGLQRRESPTAAVWITSLELGAYVRW